MLKEIVSKLRELSPERMEQIMLQAMRDKQNEIVNLNKEQLMSGEDSLGGMLAPYKSDVYAEKKLKYNPLGVTDLNLTGAFQEGFFLNADQFPSYIFSTDDKTRKLAGQYGADIFGLQPVSIEVVAQDVVLPVLRQNLADAIHV